MRKRYVLKDKKDNTYLDKYGHWVNSQKLAVRMTKSEAYDRRKIWYDTVRVVHLIDIFYIR